MSASELIRARRKPGFRYATNESETVIAVWDTERDLWCPLHTLCIDGKWRNAVSINVNGAPLWVQDQYREVL